MDPSRKPTAPRYGWQHVAFALAIAALLVAWVTGLVHAAREGRMPGPTLDLYSEVQALESRGELRKAMRRLETLARLNPGDAQPWRRVAELAARAGDLAAEVRARREIAALERRNPQAQLELADALRRASSGPQR